MYLFSQPKTSNLVSPKYILQTRKTVKIKTSNPCPIHSRVPDRVFRPLHGLTCEPFPCYTGGRRRGPVSTATRSRNRMLADGEEIHYPCTTSLGVPSPRGLGVSIDSVDTTNIRTRGCKRGWNYTTSISP